MARKLTPTQIEALQADYDAWNQYDPDNTTTADDIAAKHGVSKQTMYTYLKNRKRATAQVHTEAEVAELRRRLAEAQEAALFLTSELMVAKALLAQRENNGAHA